MTPYTSWAELRKAVIEMHHAGRNAEAAAALTEDQPRFPNEAETITFWRVCFLALSGQADAACRVLEAGLDQGYIYSEMNLRDDPDVASLQGRPDYETLVARNMAALEQLKAEIKPHRIDLLPENPSGQAMPLLVALHGNGANAEANRHHWNGPTAQGWMVTMPQSTQPGGRNRFVWDDVDQAVRDVLGHVQDVSANQRIDGERIVLGGFSMGGQIAPKLALSGTIPARGFVVLGPYIPPPVLESWKPMIEAAAQRGLRGYVVIGEEDRPCLPLALALHQAMVESGAACKLRRYPGLEHEYPADWETVLMDALAFITG